MQQNKPKKKREKIDEVNMYGLENKQKAKKDEKMRKEKKKKFTLLEQIKIWKRKVEVTGLAMKDIIKPKIRSLSFLLFHLSMPLVVRKSPKAKNT